MTSKLTRERLEEIRDYDTCVTLEESAELARMALAAMGSEPVAYLTERHAGVKGYGPARRIVDAEQYNPLKDDYWAAGAKEKHRITPLYSHVGVALVVPKEMTPTTIRTVAAQWGYELDDDEANAAADSWNACRAAMLQAGNPAAWWQGLYGEIKGRGQRSARDFTPDLGMSTEDIIDAINKRHVSDAGYSPAIGIDPASGPDRTVEVRYVAPPGYVMVPKEPMQAHLNSIAMRYRHDFYLLNDAQKDSALATARQMYEECSGQGFYTLPAAPQEDINALIPLVSRNEQGSDRWIPVSERMPEGSEEVLCAKEFDGPGDWRKKVGYWLAGKWTVYGASWTPTHWMPLPAAPQEVNSES